MTATLDTKVPTKQGRIVQVIGAIVDVEFPSDALPEINNALTTNGGNINFYKPVFLASTTPISTKITEASSAQSGNVSFYQDVTLAAPGYAVTINAQGPQSGANFTGRGGNIDVKGNIVSGTYLQQYPQALTLDTTGADAGAPASGPGAITLGTSSANYVGGAGTAGLKSLTLVGQIGRAHV